MIILKNQSRKKVSEAYIYVRQGGAWAAYPGKGKASRLV